MKSPSDDPASYAGGDEQTALDYEDFFSVLMYYGHMSKGDILHSSRPFLYGIYKKYAKRACENLGVSPNGDNGSTNETKLTESDYPVEFKKLSKKERAEAASKFESDEAFLGDFKGFEADKYGDLKIL